jgi:hypothetical protein
VSELNNRVGGRLQQQLDAANAIMLEGAELPSQLVQARAQLAEAVMERYMMDTLVDDTSALASCQALHTLKLARTKVKDVSALALCQSLHTLDLSDSEVNDVSALASCEALHTLDLSNTDVSDVSALASCPAVHTLDLSNTDVSDMSVMERYMLMARVEEVGDTLNASKARADEAERLVTTLRDNHRRAVSELTSAVTEAHLAVESKMAEVTQVRNEASQLCEALEQARESSGRVHELESKLKEVSRQAASEHNNDMERKRAAMQEAMAQRDDLVKDCAFVQQNLDTIKAEVAGLKQRVTIKDVRIAKLEQSKITKQIVNKMNKSMTTTIA